MVRYHVFRIPPGKEVVSAINEYCAENGIKSGLVLGIIGSLSRVEIAYLRSLPGDYFTVSHEGPLEIVCAMGNIARHKGGGECIVHIHITVSDRDRAVGGHFVSGTVFSTAEVAILEFKGECDIERELDPITGLKEITRVWGNEQGE